jgi:ABC-2 type transport system permease protein
MSLRSTLRATPALLRIGFSEAVAYRAEMFVWFLATTMPLIMLALWDAVARDEPLGRFGQAQFGAYFLATFIVRQLTGSWASWQMNMEVREGTLAIRLLRPVHPLWAYAMENVAAMPMRIVVSVPVAAALLFSVGARELTHSPLMWCLFSLALLGGWLITLMANFAIGALAFFLESSVKVMDIYIAGFFVFSGYLIPIELFPPAVRAIADLLPFRYQIGLPVELVTSAYDANVWGAFEMIARQWLMVLVMFLLTSLVWRRGLRRFAAYGG